MQHRKGIKNLSEINKYCSNNNIFLNSFGDILKEFKLNYINLLLSKSKSKGENSAKIFQILFVLQFFDITNIRNFYQSKKSQCVDFKKDVFYDLLKIEKVDWRKIMYLFVKQLFMIISNKSIDDNSNEKPPTFFLLTIALLKNPVKP